MQSKIAALNFVHPRVIVDLAVVAIKRKPFGMISRRTDHGIGSILGPGFYA